MKKPSCAGPVLGFHQSKKDPDFSCYFLFSMQWPHQLSENHRSSASKRPPPHLPQSSQICLVLPHSTCVSRTVYTVVLKITWTKQKKQTTNNGNVFHTLFIVGDPQLDRKQRTVEWVSVWMKDEWIYRSIQACEGLLGELEKSDDWFIIWVDDHRGQVCFFSHIVFLHSKLSILHSWALCLVKK